MVIFDQLRISDNGTRMYINVHINRASYFENMYIDSITIMTADKVSETSPYTPDSEYIYKYQVSSDKNLKELDLVVDKDVIFKARINTLTPQLSTTPKDTESAAVDFGKATFSQDLFFVYVNVRGIEDPCAPCELSDSHTLGVVFDDNLFYQKVMDYTRQLADDCNPPQGFVDFILLWNAFKASIETEHFVPAIKFYEQMFRSVGAVTGTKGCGCHG